MCTITLDQDQKQHKSTQSKMQKQHKSNKSKNELNLDFAKKNAQFEIFLKIWIQHKSLPSKQGLGYIFQQEQIYVEQQISINNDGQELVDSDFGTNSSTSRSNLFGFFTESLCS